MRKNTFSPNCNKYIQGLNINSLLFYILYLLSGSVAEFQIYIYC